jgi:hypothetical protein
MRKTSLVAALLTALACGGSDPLNPAYQPQIVNDAANAKFEFQLTGVRDGTGALSYTWQNPSATASVDRSSSISSGAVTLRIRDAANPSAVVYEGALNGASGSVPTAGGAPGPWTIEVGFANATGTINFRVQKGP